MLRNLHVKNLALIDEAEVDFEKGLNILTGETGAGKSIIIGSINLALGEKVSKEMLRDNEENAFVELIFDVESDALKKALSGLDVYPEDDMLILSRKISGGRSIAKINGESVPASKMKAVSALLIDIHGQHEHQSLLKKQKHLEILDDYARNELSDIKSELKETYKKYREVTKELEEASLDEESRMRELSLLEYEIHEIEEAALTAGEDEVLETKYRKLLNGKKIMEAIHAAHGLLSMEDGSASELTGRAHRELSSVADYDDAIRGMADELLEIDNLLNDLNREIADYMDEAEFDDETFAGTEQRLDEINHLKAKYGHTIDEILASLEEKQEKAEKLQNFDTYHKKLLQQENALKETLQKQSEKASAIRKKYAKELAEKIREQLVDLNFLDVRFEMKFEQKEIFGADGFDEVEFVIATNPGEPLKPLGSVASGGELSRIMLALKTVLAKNDEIETLIFDEIDTGISGRTAQMVSEKMHMIAEHHQVICITHLPQIAAMADAHFSIEKSVENETTISTIRRLTEDEQVTELARMLGGVKITDTVLESAREMLNLAQNAKK